MAVSEVTITPRNANPAPEAAAEDRLPGKSHYYAGNDPSAWVTDVPQFGRVRYRDVYDGVDLVYYGAEGKVEFDFVVAAGADPDPVELSFHGVNGLEIDENGDLLLDTPAGVLRQHKPVAYQEGPGGRSVVAAAYRLTGDGAARFELGPYDRNRPLVVDPILDYASYVGGNGYDWVNDIAFDSSGNLYACGGNGSTSFPAGSQLEPTQSGEDAFMMKLSPDGKQVLYRTQIGGSGNDVDYIYCNVRPDGSAVMSGYTSATDFPQVKSLQNAFAGGESDVFVTLFSPTGQVTFSTYLGGNDTDGPSKVEFDGDGNFYIAGWTSSTNFPRNNALQNQFGGGLEDGFITKFSPTGSARLYSTFFGGSGDDFFNALAVDSDGAMYGSGFTDSTNLPVTPGAYQQASGGGEDAFAVKINPAGSEKVFSTYLGGSDDDWSVGMAIGPDGSMYVGGNTYSNDFPVLSIQANNAGNEDVFLTKLNPTGTGIVHSTYIGGSQNEGVEKVVVNSYGEAYVTGWTESNDFPLKDATQAQRRGGDEGFLFKVNAEGTALVYSTYLGTPSDDIPLTVDIDRVGGVVAVAGYTEGAGFRTVFPAQAAFGGSQDGFLSLYVEAVGASAASYARGELAPDSIGAVFGANFSAQTLIASESPAPTSLLGVSVTIMDSQEAERECGMFFIAAGPPSQINFHVPGETALGPAVLTVKTEDGRQLRGAIEIVPVAPGLFSQNASGQGVAAANVARLRNGAFTYELAARFEGGQWVPEPIDMGPESDQIYLFLYGTGMRGAAGTTATVGGEQVGVAGPVDQGEFIGLDQMNLGPLPRTLIGRGVVDIVTTMGDKNVNVLTVAIQ